MEIKLHELMLDCETVEDYLDDACFDEEDKKVCDAFKRIQDFIIKMSEAQQVMKDVDTKIQELAEDLYHSMNWHTKTRNSWYKPKKVDKKS